MGTKKIKMIYWISTTLVSLMMAFSAYLYLTNETIKQAFHHLGFPGYFRVELAVVKILGAVLLLLPIKGPWKEWAYAGFAFTFVSAFIAHTASGDPINNRIGPVVFLIMLLLLYFTYHKAKAASI